MRARLAIALYRCEVAGYPTGSLDIQVRYFNDEELDVEESLRNEQVSVYNNEYDEEVAWPFVGVLALETVQTPDNGSEVVGVIADCHEFARWAGLAPQQSAADRVSRVDSIPSTGGG